MFRRSTAAHFAVATFRSFGYAGTAIGCPSCPLTTHASYQDQRWQYQQ